jgi:predicted RNA-binding protein YlqC (UPF0109 family)
MRDLIEYIAKSLVENPDEVRVTQARGRSAVVLRLIVAQEDKGWVIGRQGRVANAMRTLLRVAASTQGRRRAILEIV